MLNPPVKVPIMNDSSHFYVIYTGCITDYHQIHPVWERIDRPLKNPYHEGTLEYLLYHKNHIDNVQWDLEDLIRDPEIVPEQALQLKQRIDKSNQHRTDIVEKMDDVFLKKYHQIIPGKNARINTESIAWALDRLSILALKIYHMRLQTERKGVSEAHRNKCTVKLEILETQKKDLIQAIDELMEDIAAGKRIMKVYRQMKMYNDPALNPVLYASKNKT